MTHLKLYDVLQRVPQTSGTEAQVAIDQIAFKDEVATKADVTKEIASVKMEIAEVKVDIARLDAKIEKTAKHTIMWMAGLVGGLFVGFSAVMFTVVQILLSSVTL